MDFDKHLREMAAHLVKLDRTLGWQDYVWERLKELRRADPMYAALPGLIRELLSSSPCAPAPGSTPASTGESGPSA